MTSAAFKRVYKSAEAVPARGRFAGIADGYSVALDGKPIHTPAKAPLIVPTRALAAAIAEEWSSQGDTVAPATMPMMTFASTAIDRVAPQRQRVIEEIAAYGGTDLVCYRAEAPADLVRRQQAAWQPLVDWAALTYDAPLGVTAGIVPLGQPAGALNALSRAVAGFDDLALAGLHVATAAAGSLVIALALAARRLDVEAAFAAAQLDETYQIEKWGEDAEATVRRAAIRADLDAADRLWRLLEA
ncbi:MAG: ATPase [Alphaproteobacteria bacterium]|nr:ATPase [Alphaproteobacteria bacterium]